MATSIVWFRQDLRLEDQPALAAAAADGPFLPVYILDDSTAGPWAMGGAQRWWLHHSLTALQAALKDKGLPLYLARGRPEEILPPLAKAIGATKVHASAMVEPWARDQDVAVAEKLDLHLHSGQMLSPPGSALTGSGGRFLVFTPFWRSLQTLMPPSIPQAAPKKMQAPEKMPKGETLASWGLLPTKPNWAKGFAAHWQPGEAGAKAQLARFAKVVGQYEKGRDHPAEFLTSRLSPHLHFGELSIASAWHAIAKSKTGAGAAAWLRELGWRDFAHDLLDRFPDFPEAAHRPAFEAMPWTDVRKGAGKKLLQAWQRGQTGYPIVDAGMRELWQTGFMHNRVRMIVASFLTKHLMIDWREGERWFWDTLLDANLPNNAAGWQWVAGSGVDAAPYFRIFAPVSQSRKFDGAGVYLRRFLPELAKLSDADIHAPWEATPMALAAAAVVLGKDYPHPIVDHGFARTRALAAYKALPQR